MARSRRKPAVRKPAAEVDFSDSDEARAWFERQPREVCIALATRSALRLLPLIDTGRDHQSFAPRVALPVLRACYVVWATAAYISRRSRLRRAADIAADYVYDAAVEANAAADAVAAAIAAYDAAFTAATAAAYHHESNLDHGADAAYADTAYAAVHADAVAIERGRAVTEIVAAPLWRDEMPERIAEAWDRLRTWMLENEANNWHPWVQWYERVRDGRPSFGEAFDLAVASLTDEQWNEEPRPAAVNRHIAALLAQHTVPLVQLEFETEPTPEAEPDPAASDARQSPKPNRRSNSRPAKPTARTTIGKALLERSEQVQLALVAVISLIDDKLHQLRANRPNHPETIDEWTNEISEVEKLRGIVEGLQSRRS